MRLPPAVASLLFGPLGYVLAGHRRRAIVSAAVTAVLLVGFAYVHYLGYFTELDLGGTSPREATDTAIAATRAWLAAAPRWAWPALGLLFFVNVACAIDVTRLTSRRA